MTHYDVLGVRPSASFPEIRTAYRQHARTAHPDVTTSDAAGGGLSEPDIRRINEAWRVLSNRDRRRAYDDTLTTDRNLPEHPMITDRFVQNDSAPQHLHRLALAGTACMLIVLGSVGVVIAQFTATTARTLAPTGPISVGQCVTVRMGMATPLAGCDEPNDGRVERIIARNDPCDPDERRADAFDGSRAICLSAD